MMNYAAIPWPWVGLALDARAARRRKRCSRWLGANPSLAQTSYRMLVMTIGVTSLALILLPPRRPAYLLGFLVCAGLMALGAVAAVRPRASSPARCACCSASR